MARATPRHYGVRGRREHQRRRGVGQERGTGIGVHGESAHSGAAIGIGWEHRSNGWRATAPPTRAWPRHQRHRAPPANAGYFDGKVQVTGTISKGGGSFKIDHPLDPEHKYLYHSFVESPDMKNVYDGTWSRRRGWPAVVQLPEWFEALNRDFRYQLTVIGRFAQAIVEQEIEHNRFAIRTNLAGVKVSWQVTGIRKDACAERTASRSRRTSPRPSRARTCTRGVRPARGEERDLGARPRDDAAVEGEPGEGATAVDGARRRSRRTPGWARSWEPSPHAVPPRTGGRDTVLPMPDRPDSGKWPRGRGPHLQAAHLPLRWRRIVPGWRGSEVILAVYTPLPWVPTAT